MDTLSGLEFMDANALLEKIKKKIEEFNANDVAREGCEPSLHPSAILIPLVVINGELKIIFTRRSSALERHQGQVSFPGGLVELGDKSPIETALRETCEEINIRYSQIEVLGALHTYKSQSGYCIFPVVGFIHNLNGLQRNGEEVERIFFVPYHWLVNPKHSALLDFQTTEGITRKVWFFDEYEGELLWGITADITKIFIGLIEN